MCGFAGYQGRFPPTLISSMTQAIAHRGHDGKGLWHRNDPQHGLTALGHRRLAIIDLSTAGLQPMKATPDAGGGYLTGVTIAYNGEIYNYRELRRELEADGHQFRSQSDTEVLLHLYERDGVDMLSQLNGIFAFAICDERPSGRPEGIQAGALFLARDPLGVKPLYWTETPDGVLFASEMKALLCHRGVSRALDLEAVHQTLALLWTPAPRTTLAAVRKFEPGEAMVVQQARVSKRWSYYHQPYSGETDTTPAPELARTLAAHVETAVVRQLVADVPVGAFLSGGLDSSAIVAMMRRAWPDRPITCFSIGFAGDALVDGNPADRPYARRVAAHLGVDLVELEVDAGLVDRLQEMVRLLDEPQADPAPLNALVIAERARVMGIPVLLSGAGGDDLFGGYRRHLALRNERAWSWWPEPVRRTLESMAVTATTRGIPGAGKVPIVRRLAKAFSYAGHNADARLASYFLWSPEVQRRALYSPSMREATAHLLAITPLLESLQRIPREHDRLQRMLFLETRHFLADHNLNYTDRAGMAAGVEVRVPLLDRDLVSFACRVPSAYKQHGHVGKALFKKAMEPYLPHDVIYRPKSGFGAPLRRWLKAELRDLVADVLSPASLRRRGLFDPEAVALLCTRDRAGAIDATYTIFALVCFELWARTFVDGSPTE
jgi:asparagine synthase (glutamine-hydrolysing)